MALNWAQLDPHNAHRPLMLPGAPLRVCQIDTTAEVLFPGERTVESLEQAGISLEIPPTLSGPKRSIKSSSTMWLTNQRIVFLSTSPTKQGDAGILGPVYSLVNSYLVPTTASSEASSPPIKLESITIPYSSIRDITFEQGLFTPNGLRITFIPVPEGNFPALGRGSVIVLQVSLTQGRVYEVWKRARELWVDSQGRREEEETLPKYTPN